MDLKKKKDDLEECIKLIAQFIEAREAVDVTLNALTLLNNDKQ